MDVADDAVRLRVPLRDIGVQAMHECSRAGLVRLVTEARV